MPRGRKARINEKPTSSSRSVRSFFEPKKKPKVENKERVEVNGEVFYFPQSEPDRAGMERVEVDGEIFYFPIDQPKPVTTTSNDNSTSRIVKKEDEVLVIIESLMSYLTSSLDQVKHQQCAK